MNKLRGPGFAAVIPVFFCLQAAQGAFIMNVVQSGANVVATGSGSINTTALTNAGTGGAQPGVFPTNGNISVGTAAGVNVWTSVTGPSSFGSGPFVAASSGTGTLIQLSLAAGGLDLAQTYVSGTVTSGTATWNGTTIAALGLTPGTYTYTWGSGVNADSFTLNIASSPSPTPAPSSVYLVVIAILILAAWQMIRMRKSAA
jgi:hypothetical protein